MYSRHPTHPNSAARFSGMSSQNLFCAGGRGRTAKRTGGTSLLPLSHEDGSRLASCCPPHRHRTAPPPNARAETVPEGQNSSDPVAPSTPLSMCPLPWVPSTWRDQGRGPEPPARHQAGGSQPSSIPWARSLGWMKAGVKLNLKVLVYFTQTKHKSHS